MPAALDIGLSGLRAAQASLDVAAHNIANAGVEGYTRQRAKLVAREAHARYGAPALLDGGVVVEGIERISDRWIARHLRTQLSDQAYQHQLLGRLGSLEAALNDTDDAGIGAAFNTFFASLSDLSDNPENYGVRVTVLSSAKILASRIQSANSRIEVLQIENRNELEAAVDGLNRDLGKIGDLNQRISFGMAAGDNVSDLQDERDRLLSSVAERVGGQITLTGDEKLASITVGGTTLLLGRDPVELGVNAGGVFVQSTGSPVNIQAGSVAAMLELRDTILPQYAADLDTLAAAVITDFNAVHAAGFGTNGATGLDLFGGSDAGDIAVSLTNPADLAASATGAPGDHDNARALLGLRDNPTLGTGGTLTFEEWYQEIVGGLAGEVSAARSLSDGLDILVDNLKNNREAVHGVSLDEEMTDLIRFQQAYSAAARVIQVVDELMESVLAIGR